MRRQPAADADVAGKRRIGRAAHEIEHLGAVEHAEMGRKLQRLGQPGQHRDGDLHEILREQRARTQLQERQADLEAGAARAPLDEAFDLERVQEAQQRGAVDLQRLRGLAHVEHRIAFGDVADQPHRTLHRRRDIGAVGRGTFVLALVRHGLSPCRRESCRSRVRPRPAAPGTAHDRRPANSSIRVPRRWRAARRTRGGRWRAA